MRNARLWEGSEKKRQMQEIRDERRGKLVGRKRWKVKSFITAVGEER